MINKSDDWSSKRRKNLNIPIGRNILFIYCGRCTEPNYFNAILDDIKKNMEIKSNGITSFDYDFEISAVDPINMAKLTPKIVAKKGGNFSEVYVVFDKDSFKPDNFDNAIKMINELNSEYCLYEALWSNQCVELWFILNFEYLQAQLERESYFGKIGSYLKVNYKKNISNIAEIIKAQGGSWKQAIKFSEKLKGEYKNMSYSNQFPCTNIDAFFKRYKEYIKNYQLQCNMIGKNKNKKCIDYQIMKDNFIHFFY